MPAACGLTLHALRTAVILPPHFRPPALSPLGNESSLFRPEALDRPVSPMNHTTGNSTRLLRLAMWCLAVVLAAPGCRMVSHEQNASGVREFNQGQYQLAIQKFQHAVANNPSNADSYYNLAATYHRLGKLNHTQPELDQAENYYNQCLDHDPNHRDCYRSLAVLLAEENRTEQAFTLLETWADHNPSSSAPKVELARLSRSSASRTPLAITCSRPCRSIRTIPRPWRRWGSSTNRMATRPRPWPIISDHWVRTASSPA